MCLPADLSVSLCLLNVLQTYVVSMLRLVLRACVVSRVVFLYRLSVLQVSICLVYMRLFLQPTSHL